MCARICAIVVVMASASGAAAQQEIDASAELKLEPAQVGVDSIPELLSQQWRVQIEPSLWRPGLFGDIQATGSAVQTALEDIDLDESGYGALIEAVIHIDSESSIRFNAFTLEQSERAVARAAFAFGGVAGVAGDAVSSEVRFSSLEVVYDWALWSKRLPARDARDSVSIKVDAYAGLRAYDIAFDVTANGGTMRADQQWLDAIFGIRLETELTRSLAFDVAADVGGGGIGDVTSSSANIQTGIHYRPNGRFGVQFGYKFLFTSVTDGDGATAFEWNGSAAGIYVGAIWRF